MNIKSAIILISLLVRIFPCTAQYSSDTVSINYRKPLFDFDPKKAVFRLSENDQQNNNRFLRFSVLTGYRQGVAPINGFTNFTNFQDQISGTTRLYMYNLSKEDILTHGLFKANLVLLEVKDPSQYRYSSSYGSKEEWMRKNAYCFELLLPTSTINGVNILNKELARVFGVEFGMKKRLVDALILIRTSKIDKIKSLGIGERRYTRQGYLNNITIDKMSSILYEAGFPPMINETGYTEPVDLNLQITSETDLHSLKVSLQKYDLDLKQEKREVNMFVISEKK